MIDPTVLLVEDDPIMGESLQLRLRLEHFAVDWVRDLHAAHKALQTRLYPLVLSDIRLPDGDGGSLLATMLQRYGGCCPPVVFMTGYGSVDQAVHLVREGAWDYIQKPFDVDTLMQRIAEWILPGTQAGEAWFGPSPASQALERLIDRVAALDLPVLIQGESGTGKELVAQHMHVRMAAQPSARRDLPMVAINCAAIHDGLLESELFGHEAGAFTGANKRHRGVFEQADGGVLFLDEIGDMPLPVQAKLLRVLQDGLVRRLGSEKDVQVSVRLICATHKPLDKMAEAGSFRKDLLFRISGVPIHLPPLRERADDIAWLAHRRIQTLNAKTGQSKRLDPRLVAWAKVQPWEGNVRELFSVLDRAYHFASDCWVRWERSGMPCSNPESSPFAQRAINPATLLGDYLARAEREYLARVVGEHGGKMAETAEVLGISRKTLWEKLRRHKIAP